LLAKIIAMLQIVVAITIVVGTASATAARPRLLLVIADTLDVADIANDPLLATLANQAALGLMNCRTANRPNSAATHLSIGAGTRMDAPVNAVLAFGAGERFSTSTVAQHYYALTGIFAPTNSIAVTSMPALVEANPAATSALGWLGDQLKQAGLSVALLGNADIGDTPRRHAALLLMDKDGLIPAGDVSRHNLQFDTSWPLGWRTNYTTLATAIAQYASYDLLVVECADLSRLDASRPQMLATVWQKKRQEACAELGRFLQQLLNNYGPTQGVTVMLVSPTPSTKHVRSGHWLTPLLVWQPNAPAGLLYSTTTRTAGVLTNLDVAPAILAIVSAQLHNSPLRIRSQSFALDWAQHSFAHMAAIHDRRPMVLQTYVVFCIGLFLFALLVMWQATKGLHAPAAWPLSLLFTAAFPLALLWLPTIATNSALTSLAISSVLAFALAWAAWHFGGHGSHSFGLLFAITTLALVVDICFDSPLIRRSFLGYDAMVGARYYGLGNEYMGLLLATTILTTGIMLDQRTRRSMYPIACLLLAVVALAIGAPFLGANNGGGVAALVGFATTVYYWRGQRVTWPQILFIAGLLSVALALALLVDLHWTPQVPTHLGRLFRDVLANGLAPLIDVVGRKLAMNWKLMRYTIWTRVLVISLAVSLALLARPIAQVRALFDTKTHLLAATKGALIAALVALLANDSGVVAAATAMIPITTLLLYFATTADTRVRTEDLKKRSTLG
jgi:hypothetical protein